MDLSTTQLKMSKAINFLKSDLVSIHTGRATPALIENVEIIAYGGTQKMKLEELGTITVLDAKTIVISPWDQSVINEIYKGIMAANIGLTPVVDSQVVRMSVPSLTEERRLEFVKLLKQKLEAGRIMIRQIRHEFMSDLKRAFESEQVNEDERDRLEKELQETTDEMNTQIEEIGREKEKELMTA